MPENRLKSGFSAVQAHKQTPLQAILRRGLGLCFICKLWLSALL